MFPGSPNVETMVLLEKTKKKPASGTHHGKKNVSARKPRGAEKDASSAPKSNRAAKKAARFHGAKRKNGRTRPE
jgi:hypothetical protein